MRIYIYIYIHNRKEKKGLWYAVVQYYSAHLSSPDM